MSKWTVPPDAETIQLKHPDSDEPFWIKVKKYLTVGEQRAVTTAGWRGMSSDQQPGGKKDDIQTQISIDWQKQTFARSVAYLVAWSLSAEGVDLNREGIESLEPDVYKVIEDAITAHVEEMERQKKVKSTKILPSTISA